MYISLNCSDLYLGKLLVRVLSTYLSSARFIKDFTISRSINASKSNLVISIIVVRTVVSMAHYQAYHLFRSQNRTKKI